MNSGILVVWALMTYDGWGYREAEGLGVSLIALGVRAGTGMLRKKACLVSRGQRRGPTLPWG